MAVRSVTWLAAAIAATGAAFAQGDNVVRINGALEGDKLPFLCRDRASVGLILPIVARAQEARAGGDNSKAQSLMEVAGRLQNEICLRPGTGDVVILRCKLDQADNPGGSVATVKVGAILQSDPAKVEQPFYAWTNAVVDESSANGSACTDEAGGDVFQASQDILLRVQQRLYDFGLRMADLNGQMTQETIQALTQFQKWAKLPETGQLTKQTLEKLFVTPAGTPWVTFAFDGYGNYAATTGATRRNAELGAIEQLQRRSRSDFKVSSVAAPNCLGFAVTRYSERYRRSRTNFTQAFTSVGDTVDAASKNAFAYCEREKGGGECDVRYVLCATGEDLRDSQQSNNNPEDSEDRGRRDRRDRRDRREGRDRRDGRDGGQQEQRFDPRNAPVNSQAPRFDPGSLPLNSQGPSDITPRFSPGSGPPSNSRAPIDNNGGGPIRRFDPRDLPANSPPAQ
jgi:hypothetical protein